MTDTDAALSTLEQPHLHGHLCLDQNPDGLSNWWNPNAGRRTPCPPLAAVRTLRAELQRLHELPPVHAVIHDAAHAGDQPAGVVGAAAAGYTWAEALLLDAQDRAGFTSMGQYALEALAEHLDPAVQ